MKTFRVTYRMEVFIQADTEEQAQDIFDNQVDIFANADFVEQVSIDEESLE
jgi:hypothetical protein